MLFTWDWENTCVVYKWWHVKTLPGFLGTLIAIVVISMMYEFSRNWISRWKSKNHPVITSSSKTKAQFKIKGSLLYAFQVGYSFMLMLVFMTYNGWYMLAVVIGAALGFYLWGDSSENRAMLCH